MGEGEGGGYGAIKQNHKCEGGPAKRKPKRFLTKIVGERGHKFTNQRDACDFVLLQLTSWPEKVKRFLSPLFSIH